MTLNIESGSIVVGVDGSPDAERALVWAAKEAALERRPIAVVTAAGIDQANAVAWAAASGSLRTAPPALLEEARAVADRAVESVLQRRASLAITAHAAHGDPRQVLTDLSADAHLVVVGSRGHGAVRSRLFGSVSTTVIRHAECPVVVCRPDSPGIVRKGVLVGADGTVEGRTVLEFAFGHASLHTLPLTVLHSFHDVLATLDGPRLVGPGEPYLEEERLLLAESVAGFSEKYPDVRVDLQLARGFAHECLSADTELWNLIVVGRHPTDSVARMVSSTVATAVAERAHTTVAAVPVPSADQSSGS